MDQRFLRKPRERAWDAIRQQPDRFTINQIAARAHITVSALREFLMGLEKGGFIEEIERGGLCKKSIFFRLVKDVGHTPPAVNRHGLIQRAASINQVMWQTLRICGDVTPRMLAAHASTEKLQVSHSNAKTFLMLLRKAGYVVVTKESRPGVQARYQLLPARNTGPKPPMITRARRVIDGNTGEVWQEQPELEDEIREGTLLETEDESQ